MLVRVGALWRTLVADTYNGQHPASSECGHQFTAHVSGLILRALIQKGQEKRGFSKLLNVQLWKGRICQGFQKAFKGMSDADLDARTRPWFRFFASEPDCSEYSERRFIDKLLEMTDIDSFTDYIGWCQAFARFRRESNLAFGRRRGRAGDFLGSDQRIREGDEVWVLAGVNT